MEAVPAHVAVMMDGNGRWATRQGKNRSAGHYAGMLAIRDLIEGCMDLGITYVTVYAFSTKNRKPPRCRGELFNEIAWTVFQKEMHNLMRNNVKVIFAGDLIRLPASTQDTLKKAAEMSKLYIGLVLQIVNYGGRADLVQAIKRYAAVHQSHTPPTYEQFRNYLWTHQTPHVDLLIRTSGEQRISNFLLDQIAFAERWFTETAWPDFTKEHLREAVAYYQKRRLLLLQEN